MGWRLRAGVGVWLGPWQLGAPAYPPFTPQHAAHLGPISRTYRDGPEIGVVWSAESRLKGIAERVVSVAVTRQRCEKTGQIACWPCAEWLIRCPRQVASRAVWAAEYSVLLAMAAPGKRSLESKNAQVADIAEERRADFVAQPKDTRTNEIRWSAGSAGDRSASSRRAAP